MRTQSDLGVVLDHNLMLITHTKLKTRMDCNRLFDIFKVRRNHVLAELCLGKKKERRKKKKMNKIEILKFGFIKLVNV